MKLTTTFADSPAGTVSGTAGDATLKKPLPVPENPMPLTAKSALPLFDTTTVRFDVVSRSTVP